MVNHSQVVDPEQQLTSRGLAAIGDLISQICKFKTELASTKPTSVKPKTPPEPVGAK